MLNDKPFSSKELVRVDIIIEVYVGGTQIIIPEFWQLFTKSVKLLSEGKESK